VAYGVHTGAECGADLRQFVIDGGGYGFYSANGILSLHNGVIANQIDAFGATTQAGVASVALVNVVRSGNANEMLVVMSGLPEASSLPPPTPVCPMTGCL
jgi:hypothetical protein